MMAPLGPTPSLPGYSGFVRVGPFLPDYEIWDGVIQPYAGCNPQHLALLIDDLDAGAQVCIQQGALVHDPGCRRLHPSMPSFLLMSVLKLLDGADDEAFAIRVVVPPHPQHPKAFALYPEISGTSYPDHPHLFRSLPRPRLPELPGVDLDALCACRPGSGEWSRETSSLTTFVDFVALFLAKHVVWRRTRAIGGVWLGPDASHHPAVLLDTITESEECWCGSGRAYGVCHRQEDVERASKLRARPSAA